LKAEAFIPNFSPTSAVRQAGTEFFSDHSLLATTGLHDRSRKPLPLTT
jgi:hypothetical protein